MPDEIVIEKNVAIPVKKVAARVSKYAAVLEKLAVGDSFTVKTSGSVGGVRQAAKHLSISLAIRPDGTEFRVWRVEKKEPAKKAEAKA